MSQPVLPGDGHDEVRCCRGLVTELLLRCGRGETSALGVLVDVYQAHVVDAFAAVDPAEWPAEWSGERDELVVEAFVEIWRRSPAYVPATQPVFGWLAEAVSAVLEARRLQPTPA